MHKSVKENLIIICLLSLLSLPILFPLFHSGFLVTDDGDLLVIRLTAFHQALSLHQFPVRFLPRLNFQYGYPVSDFLYPGYLYLGEVIHLIHFGFINTIKILLGLSLLTSLIGTYYWLRQIFSRFPSIIGGLIYLYAPYHFYDVYKRGSVGEVLALAIVPFIFWAIERNFISLLVLGIALLILSHNTLAILFLPVIIGYFLIRKERWKEKGSWGILTGVLFSSLLLSAFFWIPAIYDLQYTIFSQTPVSDLRDYFNQSSTLFFNSVSIFYLMCLLVFGLLFYKIFVKLDKNLRLVSIWLLVVGVLSLLLNTVGSYVIWKNLPLSFIQFPFRLFSLTLLTFSFVGALLTEHLKKTKKYIFGLLIFVVFSFPIIFILSAVSYTTKDDMFYATNEDSTTVRNEYMPKWVKQRSYTRPESMVQEKGITYVDNKKGDYTFIVVDKTVRKMTVNMVYFPGWNAYSNGVKLPVSYSDPKGLIEITLPANIKEVTLKFGETPVRIMSDIFSLIGIGIFISLLLKDIKKQYEYYKK